MNDLKRFARRVRWLRAWHGLAVGTVAGAALALIWALLDRARVFETSAWGLGLMVAAGALIGAAVGALRRVASGDLADSIDRRAALHNHLATAARPTGSPFDPAIEADAAARLKALSPREVFPARAGRWHAGAVASAALVTAVFLLGHSALGLSPRERAEREELRRAGETVERIARPLTQPARGSDPTAGERALAEELRKLARELQRSRLSREEAMQRANALTEQAERLAKERFDQSAELAKTAEARLAEANRPADPLGARERMEAGEKMDDVRRDLDRQAAALSEEISRLQSELQGDGMTASERQAAEQALSGAQQKLQQIQLSKQALERFAKLAAMPEWQKLQELARELAEANQQAQQSLEDGETPAPTAEQLEELRQQLEELARQLDSDEAMREYIRQMEEMLRQMEQGQAAQEVGIGVAGALGMPIPGGSGRGGRGQDNTFANTGRVNLNEEPTPGVGTTTPLGVRGQMRPAGKEPTADPYVEIRAPARLTGRSQVPYQRVLPEYRQRAERAIGQRRIPKQHEQRVRDYFQRLEGR